MYAYREKYKEPLFTVLIVGEITKGIVNRLIDLLRTSQSSGLRLYIVHNHPSPKLLEPLRDFIFKNNARTLEIFIVQSEQLEEVYRKEHEKIKVILTSSPNLLQHIPGSLTNRVEVA
ncbi:MAG: hypothetical protein QXS24_03660 [Desulfurococcaceae archaeon]